MAANNVINAVGAIAGLVGLGAMIPSLLPQKTDKDEHVVRISAGLSLDGEGHLEGNVPAVALYDVNGETIGWTKGRKGNNKDPDEGRKTVDIIAEGGEYDITVPYNSGKSRVTAEYISVSQVGDNAICINYITIMHKDGLEFRWYGDVGYQCGYKWYNSLDITEGATEDTAEYTPKCVWLDRQWARDGMGIHLPSFYPTQAVVDQYNKEWERMCHVSPRFMMWLGFDATKDWIPVFDPPMERGTGGVDVDLAAVRDSKNWRVPQETDNMDNDRVRASDQFPRKPDWVVPPPEEEQRYGQNGEFRGQYDPAPRTATLGTTQKSGVLGTSEIREGGKVKSTKTPVDPVGGQHLSKREALRQQAVVITTRDAIGQSARELCESQTSYGHDFASVPEGLFCDMNMKELWPVCGNEIRSACFNTTTSTMMEGRGLRGRDARSGLVPPVKNYARTVRWK